MVQSLDRSFFAKRARDRFSEDKIHELSTSLLSFAIFWDLKTVSTVKSSRGSGPLFRMAEFENDFFETSVPQSA